MDCPEVFFPEDYPDKHTKAYAVQVARALCDTCPIKNECFTYANETAERYGIWAGTLPSER
jgi:WhiB family redox-sensing transcriptional regulator